MKNKSIQLRLFYLFSFLFIFSSINREFLFFGLDLRYIVLILGVFILLFTKNVKDAQKNDNKKINRLSISLILLFGWCLLSNISWLWNNIDIQLDQMIRLNILIANNLLAILVYRRFKDFVDDQVVRKILVFSCCVLVLSFILTGMGLSLSQISGSDARSMSVSNAIIEHKNLFGGDYRIAGYAEDANYASLFLIAGVLSLWQLKMRKMYRVTLSIIFGIAFAFACSKTVLLALPVGIIYYLFVKIIKANKKVEQFLNTIFTLGITMLSVLMPKIHVFAGMNTLSTRFKLWSMAGEAFGKSPVLGNGISSARSVISMNYSYTGGWYVQTHSTIWQLLAETGLVGLVLFCIVFFERLMLDDDSILDKVLVIILLVFALNFEVIYLQIVVYILYILPIAYSNRKIQHGKK
ncbi:O-antigen ligase family protein [Candidatus Saccharibacteria bacterium]|nr:O-antigen ligase family protein [Candidatus Saccharibacteria bacterium]